MEPISLLKFAPAPEEAGGPVEVHHSIGHGSHRHHGSSGGEDFDHRASSLASAKLHSVVDEGNSPDSRKESLASRKTSFRRESVQKKESLVKSDRKDSIVSSTKRRQSMFEDPFLVPGKLHSDVILTGDLKDTLQDYFSTQPKDGPETTTTLKPLRRPKLVFENTYRLYSLKPFVPSRVQGHIQQILDESLANFRYNSKMSANKAMEIAEKMRRSVLSFRFERYKICVLVTISPLNRQGFFSGFRCLWDANRDSYAVATMRNPTMFAMAVCYGIYYE